MNIKRNAFIRDARCFSLPCARITALLLIVALNWVGLLGVGSTLSYFTDTEVTTGNTFLAGKLDVTLQNDSLESLIGVEALGEVDYASLVGIVAGSISAQYTVHVAQVSGDTDFCNALDVEATRNGFVQFSGALEDFSLPPIDEFGVWEFEFDVPPLQAVGHGDVCDFDIAFTGFQKNVATSTESGFIDEEKVHVALTAKMVVLNEILPNPDSLASAPNNSEWIELYNNGDSALDIAGWHVSEISGGITENLYTIVASSPGSGEVGTYAGTTIIPSHGYAVILFSGSKLNNTGDTVTLYDTSMTLLDKRSFGAIAVGKTVARSPNGIGVWFDPIPTPGESNIILMGDERLPDESLFDRKDTSVFVTEETPAPVVVDTIAPVITLLGNNPALIPLNSVYSDFGALVTDNVNSNIGLNTEKKTIDTSVLGTHTIRFTATDGSGNTASMERIIIVYDPQFGMPEVEQLPRSSAPVTEEKNIPLIETSLFIAREEDVVGGVPENLDEYKKEEAVGVELFEEGESAQKEESLIEEVREEVVEKGALSHHNEENSKEVSEENVEVQAQEESAIKETNTNEEAMGIKEEQYEHE